MHQCPMMPHPMMYPPHPMMYPPHPMMLMPHPMMCPPHPMVMPVPPMPPMMYPSYSQPEPEYYTHHPYAQYEPTPEPEYYTHHPYAQYEPESSTETFPSWNYNPAEEPKTPVQQEKLEEPEAPPAPRKPTRAEVIEEPEEEEELVNNDQFVADSTVPTRTHNKRIFRMKICQGELPTKVLTYQGKCKGDESLITFEDFDGTIVAASVPSEALTKVVVLSGRNYTYAPKFDVLLKTKDTCQDDVESVSKYTLHNDIKNACVRKLGTGPRKEDFESECREKIGFIPNPAQISRLFYPNVLDNSRVDKIETLRSIYEKHFAGRSVPN